MKKDSGFFSVRFKLILFVLAMILIPVVFIVVFISINYSNHIKKNSFYLFGSVLKQVSSNFDSQFKLYTKRMGDLTTLDNFKKIINWPEYQSKLDERFFLDNLDENINTSKINSISWAAYTTLDGLFAIIETNRRSLINETPYKVHYLLDDGGYSIDYLELLKEPLYKRMLEEGQAVFGKVSQRSLTEADTKTVILYPYTNKTGSVPDVILMLILQEGYINTIVEHPQTESGTLYVLDSENQIISKSRPSHFDYYDYDRTTQKYRLGDSSIFNETGISFYDYLKFNTSSSILNEPTVKDLLLELEADRRIVISTGKHTEMEYSSGVRKISFQGNEYLFVTSYSIDTGVKLAFFVPFSLIYRPIMNSMITVSAILLLIILIIIILTVVLSGFFIRPVIVLADAMMRSGKGELNVIKEVKSNDEIRLLFDSYNKMIKDMVVTQSKVEAEEEELKITRMVAITALARLAEYRDESTGRHLERVREYTRVLASELKKYEKYKDYLTDRYIEDITSSSVLHDIGKVGIESDILQKPGKLTPEEFEIIKSHTVLGGEALATADQELGIKSFLTLAKEICFYHHEKYDGTGYPKGLKGEAIPLSARIIALADVYDALTADRCYRKAMSHAEAADIIINQNIGHFDPDIVLCFIENQHKFIEIKNLFRDIEVKIETT